MSAARPRVLALGVEAFTSALGATSTPHVSLDWRPPAHGDTDLVGLLFALETKLVNDAGESLIDLANREAFARLKAGRPVLKRVRPAHACLLA